MTRSSANPVRLRSALRWQPHSSPAWPDSVRWRTTPADGSPTRPAGPGPVEPQLPTRRPWRRRSLSAPATSRSAAATPSTARQLEDMGGPVFTLGDNAYFCGTARRFPDCYEPTWGRFKSRTRPSPATTTTRTPERPLLWYFGDNAGPFGHGYYSLQAWGVARHLAEQQRRDRWRLAAGRLAANRSGRPIANVRSARSRTGITRCSRQDRTATTSYMRELYRISTTRTSICC